MAENPKEGSLWSWQSLLLSTVPPCLLELSKSQNDMTSEKHLLAMDPRQCVGHTERRSQSDTAVNVTSRVGAETTEATDHVHAIFPECSGLFLFFFFFIYFSFDRKP